MSVINRMLRDLDRRQAMASADGPVPPRQVSPVPARERAGEWFWRIVAALVLAAVSWVGWVAWQLQPRPLVTDLAIRAAEQAKRKASEQAQAGAGQAAPPASAVGPAAPADNKAEEAVASPPAAARPETFKLARLIETPITEVRMVERPVPSAPAQAQAKAAPRAEAPMQPSALKPAEAAGSAGSISRRERPRTAPEEAEVRFRSGATLLNQGRVSEAQEQFAAALERQPSHEGARQALGAILIERGQLDEARRLLEQGLALNPAQLQFATVLGRILVEQRDYPAAAAVLLGARESGRDNAEFQLLLGLVLQRLGLHAEAATALGSAVELKPQPATTWLALAMSLDAAGRKPEALEAYRRSLAAGGLAAEAHRYAESRIRTLR
jgi:MSHA biogenesis protein MshN